MMKRVKRTKKGMKAAVRSGGLDASAAAYARLLSNPCGAALVQPVTNSVGSGQLVRYRKFINPGPDARDSVLQLFSHTYAADNQQPAILYASSNTYGLAPTTVYGEAYINLGASARRLVAGCIKVHYTNTELNRQGLVSGNITTSPMFISPTASGAASIYPVTTFQQSHPVVYRVGEGPGEFKWAPLDVADEDFVTNPGTIETLVDAGLPYDGTALVASVTNAYPGSILYEVVMVFEVQFGTGAEGEYTSGMVTAMRTDSSRNTRKDVLQSLGDVQSWFAGGGPQRLVQRIGNYVEIGTKIGAAIATVL
jgi:hypothetical protein